MIKKFVVVSNTLYFLGALTGGIAGFLYWKYVGCIRGTCMITGKLFNSIIYFAAIGALLFGIFKRDKTMDHGK